MKNVGDNDGRGDANKAREPKKIIVIDDEISKKTVKYKIENGNSNTDKNITSSMFRGFDVSGF